MASFQRDRSIHIVTSLLGTMDPSPNRRDATSLGPRVIWNGNLEPTAPKTSIRIPTTPNKAKSLEFIFLGRLASLAGYEHPQSICSTCSDGLSLVSFYGTKRLLCANG